MDNELISKFKLGMDSEIKMFSEISSPERIYVTYLASLQYEILERWSEGRFTPLETQVMDLTEYKTTEISSEIKRVSKVILSELIPKINKLLKEPNSGEIKTREKVDSGVECRSIEIAKKHRLIYTYRKSNKNYGIVSIFGHYDTNNQGIELIMNNLLLIQYNPESDKKKRTKFTDLLRKSLDPSKYSINKFEKSWIQSPPKK